MTAVCSGCNMFAAAAVFNYLDRPLIGVLIIPPAELKLTAAHK